MESENILDLFLITAWCTIAGIGLVIILSTNIKVLFLILMLIGLIILCVIFRWLYNYTLKNSNRPIMNISKQQQDPIQDPKMLPHWYFNPVLSEKPLPNQLHMPIPPSTGTNVLVITRTNKTPIYAEAMDPITSPDLLMRKPYRTIAVMNDKVRIINAKPLTDDDFEKPWEQCHADSLKLTLEVIIDAIEAHQKEINIVYEYDGIFAYAAGYWPINDDKIVRAYLQQLDVLSQYITIHFTKLTDNLISYYYELIAIADQN